MSNVSTIGVFAHANAGKTTVSEYLLFNSGMIDAVGRVDHGNTVTDSLMVEKNRGITVRASYVTFDTPNKKIQLLDTPGHIDFSAEVERAVAVLDGAVLVISGVDGVQPQTAAIYKMLSERKVPTIIFINKLDRAGGDIDKTIENIKSRLTKNIVLMNRYDAQSGKIQPVDIENDSVLDALSVVDEEVLARFMEDRELPKDYLKSRLKQASKQGNMSLVFTGSALNNHGIQDVMSAIDNYLPTYQEYNNIKNIKDFSGVVYSVKYDNDRWLTYLKVLSGELKPMDEIPQKDSDDTLKIRQILKVSGPNMASAQSAKAGDLVALPSIHIPVGQIVGNDYGLIKPLSYINPLFTVNIKHPDSKSLSDTLSILNKEDPYLNVTFDSVFGSFSIDLVGELQGEVIIQLLKERFGMDGVQLSEAYIIYKETPLMLGSARAGYRKTSQVGISIEPLPRGSGLQFKSEFSTDFLLAKYQKQIEKLLMQKYYKSALKGWELTDAKISIVDGKFDSVGSESLHYNIAGPIAFIRALEAVGTQLLEPLMHFELSCSVEKSPIAMNEISKNPNVSTEINTQNNNSYITGTAPLSFSKSLPKIFARVLGGEYSFVQREIGYTESDPNITAMANHKFIHPSNTEQFVASQNGTMMLLDKGLGERSGKQAKKIPGSILRREAAEAKRAAIVETLQKKRL